MRAVIVMMLVLTIGIVGLLAQTGSGTLNIYYIDTEGGQSTLFLGPTGESLLVDTGNAGDRDLGRIVDTLKAAGVKQIDHLWTTHYHGDHVGAMEELAKRVPIRHFYDHGPVAPNDRATPATFLAMYDALSAGKRTSVKPGDKVTVIVNPLREADVKSGIFVSITLADGRTLGEQAASLGGSARK